MQTSLELCYSYDLLSFETLKNMLSGAFEIRDINASSFMQELTQRVVKVGSNLHGESINNSTADARNPSTFARNARG